MVVIRMKSGLLCGELPTHRIGTSVTFFPVKWQMAESSNSRAVTENPPKLDADGHDQPLGTTSIGLALMTSALWGGTPVAISYSVDTLPPIGVAAIRFVLAALFMVVWCRWQRTELRLRPGQLKPVLIAGVLLFAQIGLFHLGIHQSNSSHASLFINTFVFWVVAIEHFVTRNTRLTSQKILGLIIAAAGVALILVKNEPSDPTAISESKLIPLGFDQASLQGDAILLASAFLLGVKICYTKHALKTVEPGKLIFWHDVVGVVLFAAYSLAFEEIAIAGFNTPAVWGLLYQGLAVAGLCFAVQTQLLRKHAAAKISVFSFTTPLFGIVFAWLFRGDLLSPWLIVSGVCVAVGIVMVHVSRQ